MRACNPFGEKAHSIRGNSALSSLRGSPGSFPDHGMVVKLHEDLVDQAPEPP